MIHNGIIYDADTGELIGIADKPKFKIDSESAAHWVQQRFLDEEIILASVDREPEVLRARAILANAEKMKAGAKNRLAGLHFRFDTELAEFAKPLMPRGSRTWTTLFGTVSLKKQAEAITVKKGRQEFLLNLIGSRFRNAIAKKVVREFKPALLTPNQQHDLALILSGRKKAIKDGERDVWLSALDYRPAGDAIVVKANVPTNDVQSEEGQE